MSFELVEIITKDKLVHQGIFHRPERAGKRALLWVHGLTGRFYGDPELMNIIADECSKRDMGFAAFNNRGHDAVSGFRKVDNTYVTIGAASEVFEESVFDIDAGISFLTSQGFTEVILVGHSTGANKVCYYVSTTTDQHVAGVILAGPMSDRLGTQGDLWFPATEQRKQSLFVPNSKEDVFNYGDTEHVLDLFHRITKPTLVIFSENDEHKDRPMEKIQAVFDARTGSTHYKSIIIPGANHGYDGKKNEFVTAIIDWIKTLP